MIVDLVPMTQSNYSVATIHIQGQSQSGVGDFKEVVTSASYR